MNRRFFSKMCCALPFSYILSSGSLSSYSDDQQQKNNKSIIFVFLSGGISVADSFVVRPTTIDEYAPVNGVIQTNSGFLLGANFPNLAKISNKLSIVQNYKTYDGNHSTATAYSMTGKPAFGLAEGMSAKEPSVGSLVSYVFGTNSEKNGLPTYVKLNRNIHDGNAWLSSKYMGFEATDDGVKTLKINSTPEQFVRRNIMVNDIENGNGRDDHYFKEWSSLRNQARDIVMGDAAQSFNLEKEDKKWIEKYNADKGGFGKNCLLARRLIQSGSRIVSIEHGGWDMHADIAAGFNNRSVDLDKYLSVLTEDLESKGMLDDTMIVITSEFSRTKKNISNGRDHNPNIAAATFITNNAKGLIGECDKYALVAEGNPFGPKDLFWTMFNYLGVSKNLTIVDSLKRPRHIFNEDDRVII